MNRWIINLLPVLMTGLLGASGTAVAPLVDARDAVRDAQQAMLESDYPRAIGLYGRAREQYPDRAELPYNMGVASYRAGDLDAARQYFDETLSIASDPAMRAQAAYNLATTSYVRTLNQQSDPMAGMESPGEDPIQPAMDELKQALDHYRKAIDIDPTDANARANAELTNRLMQRLQEMRQQQQQQQGQDGEPQDQDQSEQDQQDQQDQQQQQSQSDQEQNQPQQGEQEQQQNEDQQQPQQGEGEQQQQEQEQSPSQQDGESENDNSAQDEEEQSQPQAGESEEQDESQQAQGQPAGEDEQRMTREEAERLLQMIRDKERQRQEKLANAEAARRPKVDKDW